ncbi:hypothetical protein ARMGADRAFT_1081933 [Armillaria gallica]|uniref:SRA1/Sec31 domain-containing protein n=1 Tax=Armillaria gallica TaxID=47427 RepID=A0A2H3DQ10_ARMGA|nr:hypothetical protein ARMGADRAFT_1081933 [Armillaria gallica]
MYSEHFTPPASVDWDCANERDAEIRAMGWSGWHRKKSFPTCKKDHRESLILPPADGPSNGVCEQPSDIKTFKLSNLYDRYFEYVGLLASQGLVEVATVFLKLTPSDYKGPGNAIRERLLRTKTESVGMNTIKIGTKILPTQLSVPMAYPGYTSSFAVAPQMATSPYTSPFSAVSQPAATGVSLHAPYAPSVPAPAPMNPAYAPPPSNIGVPAPGFNMFNQGQSLVQPPHLRAALPPHQAPAPVPPPPKHKENGGWNDAPIVGNPRSPSASVPSKPAVITSLFPNSTPEPILGPQGGRIPPPPRPCSVGGVRVQPPPPPQRGMYPSPSIRASSATVWASTAPAPSSAYGTISATAYGPMAPPPLPGSSTSSLSHGVKAPAAPKYSPGDRTHVPDILRPAYEILSAQLSYLRQVTLPTQKRQVNNVERRLNLLFDALNCETLSKPVADQLLVLTRAMEAHDRPAALAIHVDLLTRGSQADDIVLWMSGVEQLIMRL